MQGTCINQIQVFLSIIEAQSGQRHSRKERTTSSRGQIEGCAEREQKNL